jgi:predicted phosphodiesterase
MRIVAISDTHSMHERIRHLPDGDVLVHAGDALGRGTLEEFLLFRKWLSKLPHLWKVYVPGNHDLWVESNQGIARGMMTDVGVKLLIDRGVTILGKEFYGSPWVPNLEMWAFYASAPMLRRRFAEIPTGTQVLVTHCPPNWVLDVMPGALAYDDPGDEEDTWHEEGVGLHVGSRALLKRVAELPALQLHVFGHIHESYGQEKSRSGLLSVNAAICDRAYRPSNKPIVIDLPEEGEEDEPKKTIEGN